MTSTYPGSTDSGYLSASLLLPLRTRTPNPSRSRMQRSILLLGLLLLAGCQGDEDWSPLDGPWNPNHPEAARFLEAPEAGSPIHREMAQAGERWYRVRGCLACHTLDGTSVVGPSLDGVTLRREYDWFRGMVMRPDSMLRVDPIAQALMDQYRVPMPNQGVDELRTRAMWEYLRELDGN